VFSLYRRNQKQGTMKAIFKLLFFSLLLFSSFTAYSTAKAPTPIVEIRRPGGDKIEKFKSGRDFQYETDYTHKLGLWDMITSWLGRFLFRRLFDKSTFTILEMLEYGIAIAAIIYLVYYFIKGDKRGLFSKGPKKMSLDIIGMEEDINLMDFEKLIADAVATKEYRVAIRYLYLKLLKDLSDNNLINWKTEKTNRDYINELRPSAYGSKFREVTLLFDYAWYGEASVNENIFGQVHNSFTDFYKQLQNKQ